MEGLSLEIRDQKPHHTLRPSTKRPPNPKPQNPIEEAIKSWLKQLPESLLGETNSTVQNPISNIPKRWVVYPPMVLLPSGSFSSAWWTTTALPEKQKQRLWQKILSGVAKREGKGALTHLAVNAGIPLNQENANENGNEAGEENILRTPSGLTVLYGDFGPALSPTHRPTPQDFDDAFWVSTKQNGIVQVWAPRYTMFSRGNVKEKARLLDFHSSDGADDGEKGKRKSRTREELQSEVAVDLYAGIGYFVFSYVKMGLRKVVGWEINPWSVEGLRRGAKTNGWKVVVVGRGDEGDLCGDEDVVVFLDDNIRAEGTLEKSGGERLGKVTHVNCGLLPTSEGSWEMALRLIRDSGWLHLHENVGVADIERRKGGVEEMFKSWLKRGNDDRDAVVDHVELVKTFAPGVWHCVFDVHIIRATS